MGIENKLTESEINGASVVILAVDIAIEEPERFDRIRKIKVPVQAAMKNPEEIFAAL
jgi:fructose-specific phosphotransferase system component IIB